MWISRQVQALGNLNGIIILAAPPEYGTRQLILALAADRPLAWIELNHHDENYRTTQGNKLLQALTHALGTPPPYPYGLPYLYGLQWLKDNMSKFEGLCVVIVNPEYAPQFTEELVGITHPQAQTIIVTSNNAFMIRTPFAVHRIGTNTLSVTHEKAKAELRTLPEAEVDRLLIESEGAYEKLLALAHNQRGLLIPLKATHPVQNHDLRAHLDGLMNRHAWVEALEFAVSQLPHDAPGTLDKAAHVFHEQGMHHHLFALLSRLPPAIQNHENVLFWRYSCAARLNLLKTEHDLVAAVESHLTQHDAPELRALHAGLNPEPAEALKEAERAWRNARTPFTQYQYGRLHPDPAEGIALLVGAVKLAEKRGRGYDALRNAGALTSRLIQHGRYRDAVHWGGWAFEQLVTRDMTDGTRRLLLINDWSYARLLTGQVAGLLKLLLDEERYLNTAVPDLAWLFRTTLGDYYLVAQQPQQALKYYLHNWEVAPRRLKGKAALDLVRVSLELGDTTEALTIAEQAVVLCDAEHHAYKTPALLAQGMAFSFSSPEQGIEVLTDILATHPSIPAYRAAQAAMYLARALLETSAPPPVTILAEVNAGLKELSREGRQLLSGPEALFGPVWSLLEHQDVTLELRFCGRTEVWFHGQPLALRPQWTEILACLAIHPGGITAEKLADWLNPEGDTRRTLKSALSKLRKFVPITIRNYRIACSFKADFLVVQSLLHGGRIEDALRLYQGPFMPRSDAPGVRAFRSELEEGMRQVALQHANVEVLLQLAEQFGDDLEIWEAVLTRLPSTDPRVAIAKAHALQIQRDWFPTNAN